MIKSYVIGWIVVAIVFLSVDSIWLSQMYARLYKPVIGEMLAPKLNLIAAGAFYLIYVTGIIFFCVAPTLASGGLVNAALRGAVLGFIAYATYDLTNQATLRGWDWRLTLADIAWGTFATAIAAAVACAAAAKFAVTQ